MWRRVRFRLWFGEAFWLRSSRGGHGGRGCFLWWRSTGVSRGDWSWRSCRRRRRWLLYAYWFLERGVLGLDSGWRWRIRGVFRECVWCSVHWRLRIWRRWRVEPPWRRLELVVGAGAALWKSGRRMRSVEGEVESGVWRLKRGRESETEDVVITVLNIMVLGIGDYYELCHQDKCIFFLLNIISVLYILYYYFYFFNCVYVYNKHFVKIISYFSCWMFLYSICQNNKSILKRVLRLTVICCQKTKMGCYVIYS